MVVAVCLCWCEMRLSTTCSLYQAQETLPGDYLWRGNGPCPTAAPTFWQHFLPACLFLKTTGEGRLACKSLEMSASDLWPPLPPYHPEPVTVVVISPCLTILFLTSMHWLLYIASHYVACLLFPLFWTPSYLCRGTSSVQGRAPTFTCIIAGTSFCT